jgi:hypothetical protein
MSNDDRTNDDHDLHEYFAAVRREEVALAPPIPILSLTACGHGRRQLPGKLAVGATCLATVIAAAVWLLPGLRVAHEGSNPVRGQTDASITSWKPATDFLLDTPGRELLEGVPDIGGWHGALNPSGHGESNRPLKKRILP